MDYRNAVFNELGGIECEVDHPAFGWVPFTATLDDIEQKGRDVYAKAAKTAAAYQPPSQAELDAIASKIAEQAAKDLAKKAKDGTILAALASAAKVTPAELADFLGVPFDG